MNRPQPNHAVSIDPDHATVTVRTAGRAIAQTRQALVLRETGHQPVHYIPRRDVDQNVLERSDRVTHCPFKGDAAHFHLRLGEQIVENGAWSYESPYAAVSRIKDHVAFYPGKSEAIEVHPAS